MKIILVYSANKLVLQTIMLEYVIKLKYTVALEYSDNATFVSTQTGERKAPKSVFIIFQSAYCRKHESHTI